MRLTLVIPAYNCRDLIAQTIEAATTGLGGLAGGFELIVFDDGSTDGTADAARKHSSAEVKVMRAERNRGKGAAVRDAILVAGGEAIVFTDADLAYPLGEVTKILAALEDAEVAIATRVAPESRFLMSPHFFRYLYTRHVASRAFNRMVNAALRLGVQDTQAGLKGFRRESARAIFTRQTLDSFTFDVEVLMIARRLGLRVREVPVLYRYDSEPTTVAFTRDACGAVRDLWRISRLDRAGAYR